MLKCNEAECGKKFATKKALSAHTFRMHTAEGAAVYAHASEKRSKTLSARKNQRAVAQPKLPGATLAEAIMAMQIKQDALTEFINDLKRLEKVHA